MLEIAMVRHQALPQRRRGRQGVFGRDFDWDAAQNRGLSWRCCCAMIPDLVPKWRDGALLRATPDFVSDISNPHVNRHAAATLRRPAAHAVIWVRTMEQRDTQTSAREELSAALVRQTLVLPTFPLLRCWSPRLTHSAGCWEEATFGPSSSCCIPKWDFRR